MPATPSLRACSATEVVTQLAQLAGWQLCGDGAAVAIEKSFRFADYYRTIAFVNAVAFIAQTQNHHPELNVRSDSCRVRYHTHEVNGLSKADFEAAARVDALLA